MLPKNHDVWRIREQVFFTTSELVDIMLVAAVDGNHGMAEQYRWAVVERIVKEKVIKDV